MLKILQLSHLLRASIIALTIGFFGCSSVSSLVNTSSPNTSSDEINKNLPTVVATTTVLCDLVRQVAAQTVNLACLIPPDTSPHVYRPKPEDSQAIEQATIIFYNGYNFEPNLFKVIKASKHRAAKIAVVQRAVPKPLQYTENGRLLPDPHVWHNPKNGIKMVEVISRNLSKIFPENASLYNSNAQKITQELTQLDAWIRLRIASIPPKNRKVITIHNAMSYYVKAYGLSFAGSVEGINTKEKPTAARVNTFVKNIKQVKVPMIFAETTANQNLVNTVVKDAKVKVSERQLLADNLGESGSDGDTYQKMLTANTRTIVEGLGGTYLIFEPRPDNN